MKYFRPFLLAAAVLLAAISFRFGNLRSSNATSYVPRLDDEDWKSTMSGLETVALLDVFAEPELFEPEVGLQAEGLGNQILAMPIRRLDELYFTKARVKKIVANGVAKLKVGDEITLLSGCRERKDIPHYGNLDEPNDCVRQGMQLLAPLQREIDHRFYLWVPFYSSESVIKRIVALDAPPFQISEFSTFRLVSGTALKGDYVIMDQSDSNRPNDKVGVMSYSELRSIFTQSRKK